MTHDTRDWEQEFDDQFGANFYWTFEPGDPTELKSFIAHQLQKAREEVLETLKKEIRSCVTAKGDDCYFLRVNKNSPLFSHPELDQDISK